METLVDALNKRLGHYARRQKDELARNRGNTGTIYTHTTGESNQGGDRQSGRRTKLHEQGRGI